eukprot:4875855-Prymnesium_polylepis.1
MPLTGVAARLGCSLSAKNRGSAAEPVALMGNTRCTPHVTHVVATCNTRCSTCKAPATDVVRGQGTKSKSQSGIDQWLHASEVASTNTHPITVL